MTHCGLNCSNNDTNNFLQVPCTPHFKRGLSMYSLQLGQIRFNLYTNYALTNISKTNVKPERIRHFSGTCRPTCEEDDEVQCKDVQLKLRHFPNGFCLLQGSGFHNTFLTLPHQRPKLFRMLFERFPLKAFNFGCTMQFSPCLAFI